MLTISQAVPAGAASRKDQLKQDKAAAQSQLAAQESKINNLEDQKQTLSAEIDQLDSDLVNIMVEIEILDGELSDKEAQIEQTKADLAVAEENKQKQYEAMKKRIQYLYEKGGDDAWAQMLFQASDFTSLLNQAEYVQQMYDSDRNSLEEFKETVQQVKDLGDQLDSEKAELEEMNQEYQNRQASMQTQLEEKKATSSDYDAQIAQAQNQAAQYTELIRQQNAEIQKIEEEEKKAAEEAAKKAQEEANKKAADEAAKKAAAEASKKSSSTSGSNTAASSGSSTSSKTIHQAAAQVQQHPRTTEVLLPVHQEAQAAAYHITRQDSPLLITHVSLLAILMYGVVQALHMVLTVRGLYSRYISISVYNFQEHRLRCAVREEPSATAMQDLEMLSAIMDM